MKPTKRSILGTTDTGMRPLMNQASSWVGHSGLTAREADEYISQADLRNSKEAGKRHRLPLRRHNLDPQEVCWLDTLCGHRETSISFQTRPAGLKMLFVSYATQDDSGKTERIVVYTTHLIRLLSYRLGQGAWVPKALILSSIEPETTAISYATFDRSIFPIRYRRRGYINQNRILGTAVKSYEQVHEGLMCLTRR